MKQFFVASIIITLASFYVLLLNQLADSTQIVQKTIAVPLFILLILYYFINPSWKKVFLYKSKWLLLFILTLLVQLIVLATGSFSSYFLILIHLCMIGFSFIFSFSISLLFLLVTFIVILINISFHQNIMALMTENPGPILLQAASLIPIIPIAYIISHYYHIKDTLLKQLNTQVIADELILQNLNELVIITDLHLHILSANEAVGKMLHLSIAEILDKPIFSVLLLRDKAKNLVNDTTLFPHGMTALEAISDQFTLVRSPIAQRTVTMVIQPIKDFDKNINQISFILSFPNQQLSMEKTLQDSLEKSRIKYKAMTEYIKKQLASRNLAEIKMEMIMLQKIESDMFYVHALNDFSSSNTTTVDIAQMCKHIALSQQELANTLGVPLEFKILNFGQKDIEPLIVKNFQVKPEEFTGPFFTISCNVNYLELVIKKLIDIMLLLSATIKNPHASLAIERGTNNDLIIKATAGCPYIPEEEIANIFIPYYGNLYKKTYLEAGSGLEGFLLKTASDALEMPLDVKYDKISSTITFSLVMTKS